MDIFKRLVYNYGIPFIGKFFSYKNKIVNVIYYHDIVQGEGQSFMRTSIDVFKRHIQFIVDHDYETLRFDDLVNEEKLIYGKKKVIIAFDDGWLSNYTEIFGFMQSLGITYNIFLTIGEISKNREYLTWDLVRQMHNSGLVGFGVHTYTHPHVGDLSGINTHLEFEKANEVFVKEMGYEPLDFCYPYGDYTEKSNDYLTKNTNYKRIYTSKMMYSYKQKGCIIFGRNGISNDDIIEVFKAKLKGYFNIWELLINFRISILSR